MTLQNDPKFIFIIFLFINNVFGQTSLPDTDCKLPAGPIYRQADLSAAPANAKLHVNTNDLAEWIAQMTCRLVK